MGNVVSNNEKVDQTYVRDSTDNQALGKTLYESDIFVSGLEPPMARKLVNDIDGFVKPLDQKIIQDPAFIEWLNARLSKSTTDSTAIVNTAIAPIKTYVDKVGQTLLLNNDGSAELNVKGGQYFMAADGTPIVKSAPGKSVTIQSSQGGKFVAQDGGAVYAEATAGKYAGLYANGGQVAVDTSGGVYMKPADGKFAKFDGATWFKGGKSEHNPNNWDTHLTWTDGNNYIRGDTQIMGNTNNIGDLNVGRNLNVGGAFNPGNRVLGSTDGSGNFWMGLKGTAPEGERVAVGVNGDPTTGKVAKVQVPTNLEAKQVSTSFVDMGVGDSTREANAGKIGYGMFDTEALAIVGKGKTSGTRKVHLWDDVIVDQGLQVRNGIQVAENNKNRFTTNSFGATMGINNNQWLFHTPGDGRTSMYIAPVDDNGNPIWATNTSLDRDGTLTVRGSQVINGNSSVNGNSEMKGGASLNDSALKIRGPADSNHVLVFDKDVDGPLLKGYAGGKLGTTLNNQTAVKWNSLGDVEVGKNPLKFSSDWSGFPDNKTNGSEISNDTNVYKKLMIVGNKSAGGGRKVGIWDRLDVHGDLGVDGNANFSNQFVYKSPNKTDIAGIEMQRTDENDKGHTWKWWHMNKAYSAGDGGVNSDLALWEYAGAGCAANPDPNNDRCRPALVVKGMTNDVVVPNGKLKLVNNWKNDFYSSALQIGPDGDAGKDTNIYSISFGGGEGQNYIGMGLLNSSKKFHDDTTERIVGTHIRPKGEWGVYSDGWKNLFSVQGDTGNVKVKGSMTLNNKWKIGEDSTGRLCFAVGGVNKACIDQNGNLVKA